VIRRTWVVASILWTIFWVALYLRSGPYAPHKQNALRASLTLIMATPWIGGWLLYFIVAGRER